MGVAPLLAAALVLHPAVAPSPERAIVLLDSKKVVQVALPSGKVVARTSVGAAMPVTRRWSGRMLAQSDRRVFVLAAGPTDSVVVLSARSARPTARWGLEPGVQYRGLVYAADRLFAYGGRPGREIDTKNHLRELSSVVTSLDAANGSIFSTTEVRPGDGHSWWVYSGAADATRLALSYHGGCSPDAVELCTSGADTLDFSGGTFKRCTHQSTRPNLGCLQEAHGMIKPYGVGWIAATGGEELVQFGRDGNVLRRLHSGIRKDHLMDFAFTADRRGILVLGSCSGHEGLRRISLRTGRSKRVRAKVCGTGVVATRRAHVIRGSSAIQVCVRTCRTVPLGGQILDLIVTS